MTALLVLTSGLARASVQINGAGVAYATLTEALVAAAPGDELHVGAGTYDESVVVDKDITILGVGAVTWNGTSGDEVIELTYGSDLTLRDLTVRGGFPRRVIRAVGDNVVVLEGVDLAANSAGPGGVLYALDPSSITVRDSLLGGVATEGGAIYAWKASPYSLLVEDTTFLVSSAIGDGGAIHATNAILACTRCTFQDTWADGWGGGIYSMLGSLTIEQSLFCASEAPTGHGGAIAAASTTTLRANLFVGDRSGGDGGALYIAGGTWVVENNDFLGIYMGPDTGAIGQIAGSATVRNNLFFANDGTGISRTGGTGTTTYNWFQDNTLGHANFVLDSTNYTDAGDPMLISWSQTGLCASDQLWPTPLLSPLLDAGDPTSLDPDGTRADIGAYGGLYTDPTFHEDADGDGDAFFHDCDDADPQRSEHQLEHCDEIDNDCDLLVDDEPTDRVSFYEDCDGDGQGTFGTQILQCFVPTYVPPSCASGTWSTSEGDCDDAEPTTYAGAPELCDELDNDCDGYPETATESLGFSDTDGDGFGAGEVVVFCGDLPPGYVAESGDCDDSDAAVHPDQLETCNGLDDDCDGAVDDTGVVLIWYPDLDGDGYGDDAGQSEGACPPGGQVTVGGDCDDTSAEVNPGAVEVCNGVDDDCAEGVDNVGRFSTWYRDGDGDGLGVAEGAVQAACSPGLQWSQQSGDCDDHDRYVTWECETTGCACSQAPQRPWMVLLALLLALGTRVRP
jgi:hypothetical protein